MCPRVCVWEVQRITETQMKKSQSVWMCASTTWVYVQKVNGAACRYITCHASFGRPRILHCIIALLLFFVHVETHISKYIHCMIRAGYWRILIPIRILGNTFWQRLHCRYTMAVTFFLFFLHVLAQPVTSSIRSWHNKHAYWLADADEINSSRKDVFRKHASIEASRSLPWRYWS